MDCIALEELEFFSYHGYYPEENKIGNRYNIDIYVYADVSNAAKTDRLSGTVNYEKIFRIAQKNTEQSVKLLEHLAYKIISDLFSAFPEVQKVKVNVCKFNPPIGGVCKWAKVSLERNREEVIGI
jgi:dihydroneopterin aldolase